MKTSLFVAMVVGAGLTVGAGTQTQAKEHEDENINSSSVPTVVQQAAEREAAGGKIVRWEKERGHYEAVIEKSGKEWGVNIDKTGKVLGKHDESSEKEEHEHHHHG